MQEAKCDFGVDTEVRIERMNICCQYREDEYLLPGGCESTQQPSVLPLQWTLSVTGPRAPLTLGFYEGGKRVDYKA